MSIKSLLNKIKSMQNTQKIQFLIVNLICFFAIFLILIYGILFLDPFLEPVNSDDKAYIRMAENIFVPVDAPWKYRILTPLLVYLLPFNVITGFIIVNLTSLYLTSVLMFYYLRKFDFNFKISIVGMLLFILNPITLGLLIAICVVDLLSFFFILLSFYALFDKKEKLFLFTVSVGVANREVILIMLIFYFILKNTELDLLSSIKSTLLISIIPVVVFFLIRFIYGFDANYFSIDLVGNTILTHYRTFQSNIFIHPYLIYLPFGIFWLVSLINLRKLDNIFLKKSIFLIPFIFMQAFIATNYSRLLFIAFPLIIPISLYIFKINFSKKLLISLFGLASILSVVHFIGVIYFIQSNPYSILTNPENYLFYAFFITIFDIFSCIVFTLLLLKREFFFKNNSMTKLAIQTTVEIN